MKFRNKLTCFIKVNDFSNPEKQLLNSDFFLSVDIVLRNDVAA